MTKGHGQGVLKRKNYCPQVSVLTAACRDRGLYKKEVTEQKQ